MQLPMQRKGIFGRGTWSPPTVDHPNGMTNPVGTGEGYPDLTTMPAPQQGPTFKQRLGGFLEGTVNDLMHLRGFQNTALDQRRAMEMYKQQQADTLAQYEAQQRIAAQYRKQTPYRWESNNGSLMEIGEDGQPRLIYQDPTPKVNWVRADNGDGTFTMVPVGQDGSTAASPPKPVGKLTPYGGPQATPAGGFR